MQRQLQVLLAEKARLAADNARLQRENASLHELLSFSQENGEEDWEEEEEEEARAAALAAAGEPMQLFSSPGAGAVENNGDAPEDA